MKLYTGKLLKQTSSEAKQIAATYYATFLLQFGYMLYLKVGLSPSKRKLFISFNERPLKMMKTAFYFILKPLLVLKIYQSFSQLFDHVEKTASIES